VRSRLLRTCCAAALVTSAASLAAQTPSARYILNADLGRDTISRHIYGQFAEHLGRDIYDGVWTKGEGAGGT
jgi:alpha-N-arabinofuranosidase